MAVTPGAQAFSVIGIGVQTLYGTPVGATVWMPWETIGTFDPTMKQEVYYDGLNRDPPFDAKLSQWFTFDVTTQIRPGVAGLLLSKALAATDVSTHVTGTMVPNTLTGAGNTAGSLSITLGTSTALIVNGDVMLITGAGASLGLSEYVVIAGGTGTAYTIKFPLQNTYVATSTIVNAATGIYAHTGSAANLSPTAAYSLGIAWTGGHHVRVGHHPGRRLHHHRA